MITGRAMLKDVMVAGVGATLGSSFVPSALGAFDGRQGESRLDGNSFARPLRLSGGIDDFNHMQGVFR